MVRRVFFSQIVIAISLVACAPSAVPQRPAPIAQASPAPAAPRDSLTIDACEQTHDPTACIRGASETTDSRLAHSLLFHGCFLGSREACRALVRELVSVGKWRETLANAEADRALTEGCAFGKDEACAAAGSFSNGVDEGLRVEEAKQAIARAKAIVQEEIVTESLRPPPQLPSPSAARKKSAPPQTARGTKSAAPIAVQSSASKEQAERQRQYAKMNAATQDLTDCARACSSEYQSCASTCRGTTVDAIQACSWSCASMMEPCMHACGSNAESACVASFPALCDSFKPLTQSFTNFHLGRPR